MSKKAGTTPDNFSSTCTLAEGTLPRISSTNFALDGTD
jgi:hypothetical protein